MRLLRSYCNRERATSQLRSLLTRALREDVTRPEALDAPRVGSKQLSTEANAAIVADYEAGLRATEIARKYSINESTVHHRLKRAGVAKRPNSMSEDEITLAVALRADGHSYDRIAERVGFSATTVRNMLKRASTCRRRAHSSRHASVSDDWSER